MTASAMKPLRRALCCLPATRRPTTTLAAMAACKSVSRPTQPHLHCLARTVTVGPSGIAPEQAVAWAERAVADQENAWHLHALAMAHYRAGNFAETVRVCEKSSGHRWTGQLLNRLLSAMAHHQLGKSALARLLLRGAELMARDWMPLEAGGPARCEGPADWLEFQILRREAAELLGGDCPSEKPGRKAPSDDELAPGNPPCEK